MVTASEIILDQHRFTGSRVAMRSGSILLIAGENGYLGCGYFSIPAADKFGERFAVVTKVTNFDEMLEAAVCAVSVAAAACGVTVGMTGRAALLAMESA